MSTERITVLEHELEAARRDAEAQRRNELVHQLEGVRGELAAARARYAELASRIKSEREFRASTQNLINQKIVEIDESWRQRPAVADYLPNDPAVKAWRKKHSQLERDRDKLIARRDSAPQTNVTDAVIYEGSNGIIANLERSEQNILNALNGSLGKLTEGGVFPVN